MKFYSLVQYLRIPVPQKHICASVDAINMNIHMWENIKKYLPLGKRDLTRQGITKFTLMTAADKNPRLMKKIGSND